MENETNPSTSDNPELELGSELGEKDVSKAEDLEAKPSEEAKYYQGLTGREDIKSKADFEKHYEGLKKLVGDQAVAELRKKADAYEKLQIEISKEADEFLNTKEGKETMKEFEKGAISEEVHSIRDELDDMKFLKKNPESETFLDVIKAVAKEKGISKEEAYQSHLKDLITSKLEVEKSKAEEQSIGVESKSRIAPGITAEVSQLIDKVKKTDSLEAKQQLVEKVLGLSKKQFRWLYFTQLISGRLR